MTPPKLASLIQTHCRPLVPRPTSIEPRLETLADIEIILFDIYGTLLISASGDIGNAGVAKSPTGSQTNSSIDRLTDNPTDLQTTAHAMESAESDIAEVAFELALAEVGWQSLATGKSVAELLRHEIENEHLKLKTEGIPFPEVDIRLIWQRVIRQLSQLDSPITIDPSAGVYHNREPQGSICQFFEAEHAEKTAGKQDRSADDPSQPNPHLEWRNRLETFATTYELKINPVWPMPGTIKCLSQLSAQGRPLGVISNAQFMTPGLVRCLLQAETHGWQFHPSLEFYSYRFGRAKPGLELYQRANQAIRAWQTANASDSNVGGRGIQPSRVLYIGNDQLKDVWPASQIGFRTALFAGDACSLRLRSDDPRASSVSPDLIITHWDQLLDCIVQ